MARRDNKYLGKSVPDTPPRGLSSLAEVRGIAQAVARDIKKGKIDRAKANSRLLTLWFAVKRDSNFRSRKKKARALSVINRVRKALGFRPIKPKTWSVRKRRGTKRRFRKR